MERERVIIRNNKNEKLVGYLYKNSSKTLLIICHGLDPINNLPVTEEVFKIYYESGTSIFSFDFSGHGESDGKKKLSLKQRIIEIGNVIDYFSSKYENIILYGVSFGGICAAISATKFGQVKRLITVNGFFSFSPKNFTFNQAVSLGTFLLIKPTLWFEVYYWLQNFNPSNIIVPTLVAYGEKDMDVSPKQSLSFFNKLKTNKKLFPVKGADHAFSNGDYTTATQQVRDWIKKYLV